MRDDYCDVMIVLDESGSMEPLQRDTIGGVNRFLKDQYALPGKCVLSLLKFNHEDRPVFTGRPIAEVPDLTSRRINRTGTRRCSTHSGARSRKQVRASGRCPKPTGPAR